MIISKQVPAAVLAELRREFAAGLPARIAVMNEAVEELARHQPGDAAQRLRLGAHSLCGTAATFGATELTLHAERLEALGKAWQDGGDAPDRELADARHLLAQLAESARGVVERMQGDPHR